MASASATSSCTGAAAMWSSTWCGTGARTLACSRVGAPSPSCCPCRRWPAGPTKRARGRIARGGLVHRVLASARLGVSGGSSKLPRRVGVFGGAFDPPHIAHRALARAALDNLRWMSCAFSPRARPGTKTGRLTPAGHRWRWPAWPFGAMDGVVVDPRETQRDGPSFTVDTLTELRRECPQPSSGSSLGKTRQQRCQDGTVGGRLPNLLQYV
jgi:hypothetical protein